MALINYKVTLVAKQDSPFNVLPDTDISIRKVSDNALVNIFSDAAGLVPIPQLGAKSDALGQFSFYTDSAVEVKAVWSDGVNTHSEPFRGNSLQKLSGLTDPSDLEKVLGRDFDSVANMVSYAGHAAGNTVSTGGTSWRVNGTAGIVDTSTYINLGGSLGAFALTDIHAVDWCGVNPIGDIGTLLNQAAAVIPIRGGVLTFAGIQDATINTQVLVKKHTMIDLANCTITSTLDSVIFYFNKQGLNSGQPAFHGGDGDANYWCDNTTGIKNGRLYGPISGFKTNMYLAASDRIIGFAMHSISISFANALQLNGESWLADIQSVKGYNVVGTFFKHQLNPWGNWEETPGVPIGIGNGPNNANYINCWVENRVGGATTAIGWDIQSGSASITGGYIEALDVYFKGAAIKVSMVTFGSRNYEAVLFKIDRAGAFVTVSNCSMAIANTAKVTIFEALVPTTINHTGGVINIPFSGNNCSYLRAIAEVSLTCGAGLQVNKTATNVSSWDFLDLDFDGVTTFGALNDSNIVGLTIKSVDTKWVNFLKQGATGFIKNSDISGNTFTRCDNFNKIETSVFSNNKFTGGNLTNALRLQLTDSVANGNNFTGTSVIATIDALTKATGNKGWVGTQRNGTVTASGNGSNRTFSITHGMPTGGAVKHLNIIPKNFATSSAGNWYSQVNASTIDIIFNTAPGVGTNNVVFDWYFEH
jgi:hypothetical protein